MGKIEQNIMRQCYAQGIPLPDRIANAPQLGQGLELYLLAFFDLDSERQIGFGGAGRIPWLAIRQYAELNELDDEQLECLLYLVQELDGAYLNHINPKDKTK